MHADEAILASEYDGTPEIEQRSLAQKPFMEKIRNHVYLTLLFIGIGLLWPWNCILSASVYFKHDVFHDKTIWANIFTSSMMTVSTLSSMLSNVWLARRQHSYSERVIRGLIWEILVFVALSAVTMMHSLCSLWFTFTLVMVLVAISSVATAMTQNGIMAIANVYGSEFSQAVMVGQAVAGVLPSVVLLIISFFSNPSEQSTSGIVFYFLTTTVVAMVSVVLYRVNKIGSRLKNPTTSSLASPTIPFKTLFYKLKYLVLSIFTTFVVTLIFPVFAATVLVKGFPLSNSQYSPFIFTVWNVGDLHGRVIADWPIFRSPRFTPFKTFVYSLWRLLFIPLFLSFCINNKSEISFPVLQDLGYTILQYAFGLTNGHVISISFMKVPEQLATDEEREAAGGFTNIFVSTGLTLGSVVSYAFVYIIAFLNK
ncbi:nucleoside transmembrane transporter FUN26 TDEL_0H03740 [Torulaspora delbrueckii]|uniref:Nucleoside transporter FUN26 n=1 Tax=Torulaspora delbrueckii TaxID=4950 RepID=G9A039_TORDE|nr:hypothetical protein TDEL_0H03740 [Torulaspora delbrueckii]CCE94233.1 hypothetical protein TDEL_0H03740 [Torulaspora delbrueckii]